MKKNLKFEISLGINDSYESSNFLQIKNISINLIHITLIVLLFLITFFLPNVWIVIILPMTIISLVFGIYPSYIQPFFPKANIIYPLLDIMKQLKILSFFFDLHMLVFYTKTKIYYFFFIVCFGLTAMYLFASRYNFYKVYIWKEAYSFSGGIFIATLLFLGVLGSYLRTLINFSNIIVAIVRVYAPELLDPILRVEPPDLPPGSNRSLFNFSKNTYNYHYPPQPKSAAWGRGSFIFAGVSTLIGVGTYYHMSRQTALAEQQLAESQRQNALTEKQNYEFKRQNDLEEVSQGLMTKEDYNKRYPKS